MTYMLQHWGEGPTEVVVWCVLKSIRSDRRLHIHLFKFDTDIAGQSISRPIIPRGLV